MLFLCLFMGYPSPAFLGLFSPSWSHPLRISTTFLTTTVTTLRVASRSSSPPLSLEVEWSTGYFHFDISHVPHPKLAPKWHSSSTQNPFSHLPCWVEWHQLSSSFSQSNPDSRNSLDTSFPSSNQHSIHSVSVNPLLLHLCGLTMVSLLSSLSWMSPTISYPVSLPQSCPLQMHTLARVIVPKHKYDCVNLLLKILPSLFRGLPSPNLERSRGTR